jgi:hypothetical protein
MTSWAISTASVKAMLRRFQPWVICLCLLAFGQSVPAQSHTLGFMRLPQPGGGLVTVFYPSSDPEKPFPQGPFRLSLSANGRVSKSNGHLIVISHGSGGSPWGHVDLARVLVERGFNQLANRRLLSPDSGSWP